MDEQEEIKHLRAQLAALQELQASPLEESPAKLRQGLRIPGLTNTGTTLNWVADKNDPLNKRRQGPSPERASMRPGAAGRNGDWWNWELVDAPKPKAKPLRDVHTKTDLTRSSWSPRKELAPLPAKTPPLLPGWKGAERDIKPEHFVRTEPKLRVGLRIPSAEQAKRSSHHTVAAKRFSVTLPAPSPEDGPGRSFRTTPRFSEEKAPRFSEEEPQFAEEPQPRFLEETQPRRRRKPRLEEKPRRRRFPVVAAGPRIVDIDADYQAGPRTAANRRVAARRSDLQLPALTRKTQRRKQWYTTPPAPSPRKYLGSFLGGKKEALRDLRAHERRALESRAINPRLAGAVKHGDGSAAQRFVEDRNRRTVLNNILMGRL